MKRLLKLLVVFVAVAIIGIAVSDAFNDEYIERWDELTKYGLLPLDVYDMKSAKRLIILAIQATATLKGNWWTAHGLLGATRIPQQPDEALYASIGYASLFRSASASFFRGTKMEAVDKGPYSGLLDVMFDEASSSSWVYMREHYLGRLGYELNDRFRYNEEGNYGCILSPAPNHKMSLVMKQTVEQACAFYETMREKGFDDKTLGDAIGVASAVLEYDGIKLDSDVIFGLPHAKQIYKDVLTDVIKDIQKGTSFSYALAAQMDIRGLQKDDIIAMPESQEQMDAIVKLIKEDLDNIEKIVLVSPSNKSEKQESFGNGIRQKIKKTIEIWKQ